MRHLLLVIAWYHFIHMIFAYGAHRRQVRPHAVGHPVDHRRDRLGLLRRQRLSHWARIRIRATRRVRYGWVAEERRATPILTFLFFSHMSSVLGVREAGARPAYTYGFSATQTLHRIRYTR